MPCTMDVNARHVSDYICEAVVYVPIMWILYRTELELRFLHVRWPVIYAVMKYGIKPSGIKETAITQILLEISQQSTYN